MASRSASRTVVSCVGPQSFSGAAFSGTGAAAGWAVAAGAAGGAFAAGCGAGASAETSSPLTASTAIGVFTGTPSVPSVTRMRASFPSSTASTSIVALSVSISAMTSPARTSSPTDFNQRESLPSVMVGDRAGIRICVAICSALQQHVGPKLGGLRFGARLREIGGVLPDLFHLIIDFFLFRLGDAERLQFMARAFDAVALAAHLLDFLARAIAAGVGHGMAAVAVGVDVEQIRPLPGAAMRDRDVGGLLHRLDVHAVHLHAGNVPGGAVLRQVVAGGGAIDRGSHAVLIVLDHVDAGQLQQRGKTEALVDLALVGGAVAEIGDGDAVAAAIPVAERQPGAQADLRADDAAAAEEILFLAEHVHGAALAM